MKRAVWIAALAFAILFLLLSAIGFAFGDAKVLAAGTKITAPDGTFYILDADEFLLTRPDMEQATYAMAVLPINEKLIADLHTLSNAQQQRLDNQLTWKIIIGVGAFAAGILTDVLVRR